MREVFLVVLLIMKRIRRSIASDPISPGTGLSENPDMINPAKQEIITGIAYWIWDRTCSR